MLAIEDCYKYEPEIKRLTKSNSFLASGRVIYVVKKEPNGKTSKSYQAYDHESKVLLGSHYDKDFLISFIVKQDLSCLGEQQALF